jgi:DNA-binding PadR family transcriptional regulator
MPTKKKPATKLERAENGFMSPQGAPRGLLHLVALSDIAARPMSGYQLMQDIEAKTEGSWRPGSGAIYPILKKLQAKGYIRSVKAGGAKGRTVYEITPAGKSKIDFARKAFRAFGERWALMRRIFSDILEPEDLARFLIQSPSSHFRFVHELMQSNGGRISHDDKLYLLRQYSLILDRELRWTEKELEELGDRAEAKALVGGTPA